MQKIIFQCEVCRKLFPTKKTVDNHIKRNHNLNECKLCPKSYKNANTLRTHVSKCHGKKPEEAKVGEPTEEMEDNAEVIGDILEEEIQVKKTPEVKCKPKFQGYQKNCDICGKPYYSRSGFGRHMKTHRNNQNKDIIAINEDALTAALGVNYVFVHDDTNHMVVEDESNV